jgi:GNAT superfamily N-acetyltransferase
MTIHIKELTSEAEILANYPLLEQLYPGEVSYDDYARILPEFLARGYRQVGLFKDGHCIGFIGFHSAIHFTCNHYLYINDLVIDAQHRAQSHATKLLNWIEEEAQRLGYKTLLLDCYLERKGPQALYHRQGYSILAFHFCKNLD